MKFINSIISKVKTRKIIPGFIVFLITLAICLLIFHYWDYLKAMIRGG